MKFQKSPNLVTLYTTERNIDVMRTAKPTFLPKKDFPPIYGQMLFQLAPLCICREQIIAVL